MHRSRTSAGFGTSPGDPFGRSRGSAIGGLIGLAFGFLLYAIVRGRFNRRSMIEQSQSTATRLPPAFANQPIMTSITAIPEDRDLTKDERSLVEWLLDHGTPDAIRYRARLNEARVAARCYCGCASIDFGIDGVVPNRGEPISILSDYEWIDTDGHLFGTFVFSRCDLLAGLEVWSQDGLAPAHYLPEISQLRPIGTASDGEIG